MAGEHQGWSIHIADIPYIQSSL